MPANFIKLSCQSHIKKEEKVTYNHPKTFPPMLSSDLENGSLGQQNWHQCVEFDRNYHNAELINFYLKIF